MGSKAGASAAPRLLLRRRRRAVVDLVTIAMTGADAFRVAHALGQLVREPHTEHDDRDQHEHAGDCRAHAAAALLVVAVLVAHARLTPPPRAAAKHPPVRARR